MKEISTNQELEQPYPLTRYFYMRLLPALVLLMAGLTVLMGIVVRNSSEKLYLERATRTAETIASDINRNHPKLWRHFLSGARLQQADLDRLAKLFAIEYLEYRLIGLKVYNLRGKVLYSHVTPEIGRIEQAPALQRVIADGTASAVRHSESGGTMVFELYVPFRVDGRLAAVFELYEPVNGDLQSAITHMEVPVIGSLVGLLAALVLLLVPVVGRAQKAITARTALIVDMRRRLERLLSRSAVETMREPDAARRGTGKRGDMTLLYSDIRGFTPYCEAHEPEQSIDMLNRIIDLQLAEIDRFGGDVDKMIGDAVLARFTGAEAEKNAVETAMAIQSAMRQAGLALQLGVGLYSGPVISGLVGTGARADFTVIGDSVNMAARLCGAAGEGEIVADAATIDQSRIEGFGPVMDLQVKGHARAIKVRRHLTSP
ncbi:MAG: adenylate/guanylate cyclase domain-containing protein [Hyphomicrobiales bacterium]|nr:MAG: adenylate/guanylate cyclase domain-containing protein [Hyphomicrobiales bacterium]